LNEARSGDAGERRALKETVVRPRLVVHSYNGNGDPEAQLTVDADLTGRFEVCSSPVPSIRPMAYRELLQRDEHLACLWTRDPRPDARRQRVLPDACVDIVWIGGRLIVAGPATRPVTVEIPPGAASMGLRFRVGAAGAALGVPADELLDASVPLEDVWGAEGARIADRVGTSPAPLRELAAAVRERLRQPPDRLVRAAATGTARQELGIGDRQLRRRFADAVGYGPKTLERILRFQRFLALARGDSTKRAGTVTGGDATKRVGTLTTGDATNRAATGGAAANRASGARADLARLALEAGYADQAHLTRECTRLAGLPPAALLATGAGPAGERSVSFKTPAAAAATIAA
jgi:AraC-like DNA-binding protein